MWKGYEWPTFLRFWSERLEVLVNQYANAPQHKNIKTAQLLPEVVGPVIPGTGIVMYVSFLERVILDKLDEKGSDIKWVILNKNIWAKELGMNTSWCGWPLIDILYRLRHCFAHNYGRITEAQREPLMRRSADLADNPVIIDWMGKTYLIGQFFTVDQNDEITFRTVDFHSDEHRVVNSPSVIIRMIISSFLDELEKVGVVDMKDWKEQ